MTRSGVRHVCRRNAEATRVPRAPGRGDRETRRRGARVRRSSIVGDKAVRRCRCRRGRAGKTGVTCLPPFYTLSTFGLRRQVPWLPGPGGGRCASAAARRFGVAASLPAGAASQPRRTTPVGGGQPLMSQVIGVDPSVATVFSAPSSMSPFSSFSAASRRRRIQSAASSLPLSRSSADSTRSNFDWARACVSL